MSVSRRLTQAEEALVGLLLGSKSEGRTLANELLTARVQEMRDGGMGSLLFEGPPNRLYGGTLAEAQFYDSDRTLVCASLNLDQNGKLFELDIWKVDFSPLTRIPTVEEITVAK